MNSPEHLTLNIHQIPEDGLHLADTLPASVLDLPNRDLLQESQDISYDLTARVIGLDLLVNGQAKTSLSTHCDRCDQPFDLELLADNFHYFQEAPLPDLIEMAEIIREELLLQIPSKILCSEDCQPPKGDDAPAEADVSDTSPWDGLDNLELDS